MSDTTTLTDQSPGPGAPYAVFQPNGGQPVRPNREQRARRSRDAKREAELESLFRRSIMGLLRGRTIKIAPTEKGAPDRLVLLPGGRIHLVELKTETGRLSPAQRLWHARAAQLGTHVPVLYGEEDLLRWVAAHQSRTN